MNAEIKALADAGCRYVQIDEPGFARSSEDAYCHIDLAVLERFKTTTVILGCFDISKSSVETVDEVEARLKSALEHIDRERLIEAPDYGLGLLPRDIAVAKMTNLCVAAARI